METIIRKAEREDLPELLAIYNHEVENGVATLDLKPRTAEEWEKWFEAHGSGSHPIYTAVSDGKIAGYVSLSAYRDKEAYRSTAELSVYVAPDFRHRGIASELLAFILDKARADACIHNVVSVITSGNEASRHLHEKFGFCFCGTIREVGMKFGKYQDIDNYSLITE